jgi:hypothetical protein
VHLSQAVLQFEPRIHRCQDVFTDGQADRFSIAIQDFQPRDTGLANFALVVVEDSVQLLPHAEVLGGFIQDGN